MSMTLRAFRFFFLAAVLSPLFLLPACGGGTAPPKPALESEDPDNIIWPYGSKALKLSFIADKALNTFEDRAHSLQVCVYQLDGREAFDPLAATQDGINTLLQCAPFDKSVRSSARMFMQPGENAAHVLDRAEGAVWVGIVCGYFDSTPEQSAKLWQIVPKKTQSGYLFWKSVTYSAGAIEISLRLGDRAMQEDIEREKEEKTQTKGKKP